MAGNSGALTLAALLALLSAGCAHSAASRVEGIASDAVWSGRRVLDHTVVVQKGATLTILPGARLEFVRRDEDDDGIGDVALRVEGRLLARGTAAEPIVFTSAEPEPKPADWMFLILEFSRDSELAHCRFSYAYSGVQMHYTTARVADCVFSRNVDGFRFSTANVQVENNLMEHNVNGVRYEERKSRTTLRRNVIRDNEIGIFCVTEAEDATVFRENNIFGNRLYNLKMGMMQARDISLPGNWWGTADPAAVEEGIFDGRDDPTLGRVGVLPLLEVEVAGAGPHIGGVY